MNYSYAKKYRDRDTHEHIPYREGKRLTGTPRYASINALRGLEQSRRDDLESLGYVLVYLFKGKLPWQGLRASNKDEKYRMIGKQKQKISLRKLCKDMPRQFVDYFRYVKGLAFEEHPDYSYLCGLFRKAMDREGLVDDGAFDWMKKSVDNCCPRQKNIRNWHFYSFPCFPFFRRDKEGSM